MGVRVFIWEGEGRELVGVESLCVRLGGLCWVMGREGFDDFNLVAYVFVLRVWSFLSRRGGSKGKLSMVWLFCLQ